MRMRTVLLIIFFIGLASVPSILFGQSSATPISNTDTAIDTLNKQIDDKKAKIKELEDSIAAAKKVIEQKQLQSTSLKNQLSILDNHIAELQLNINLIKTKLDTITLHIQQLQLQIADKQTVIARQKQIIAGLLRQMQYQDRKTSIEVMATYRSFSDFYTSIHYLQTVEIQLNQAAVALRLAKEDLEAKQSTAVAEQQSFEALKLDLENQKKDLDEQSFSKQNLLAQTHSSELTYRTLLGNLKQQYQSVENEIASIEADVRKKLEAQHKIQENLANGGVDSLFSWPVPSHTISAYFHDPDYPFRTVFEHSGIDIRASQGTPVRAAGSGYVAQAKRCTVSSCYSYILIIHDNGLSTVYGHLSQLATTVDKYVNRGDVIAYSGGTPGTVGAGPFVTGPHLHFEVRKDGIPINPLGYLVSAQ